MKLFIGLLILILFTTQHLTAAERPNIVFIFADDWGWGDLSCHGHPYVKTPNIDRLASQGMMFTNMHASPTCAPSRAMLLTGSDSHLAGVANLPEMLPKSYQGVEGYKGVLNRR